MSFFCTYSTNSSSRTGPEKNTGMWIEQNRTVLSRAVEHAEKKTGGIESMKGVMNGNI